MRPFIPRILEQKEKWLANTKISPSIDNDSQELHMITCLVTLKLFTRPDLFPAISDIPANWLARLKMYPILWIQILLLTPLKGFQI